MAADTMGAAGPGRGGRMPRQRKRDAVLRLLRGEDLETVSRALGVTAAGASILYLPPECARRSGPPSAGSSPPSAPRNVAATSPTRAMHPSSPEML